MSSFVRVKAKEMGDLVPHLAFIIKYLQEKDAKAGELFFGSAFDVDDDEVHDTMKEVLGSLGADGKISEDKMRGILETKNVAVWAKMVHMLFMYATPQPVPVETSRKLIEAIQNVEDTSDGEEVASALKPVLDQLPPQSKEALGMLCTVLLETCDDGALTGAALGPSVLLGQNPADAEKQGAKNVLMALTEHAYACFGHQGRPSADSVVAPLPEQPVEETKSKSKRFSLIPRLSLKRGKNTSQTQVDRIIAEIIATEQSYHGTMNQFQTMYVDKIMNIAEGRYGDKATEELGISAAVIERVFGARLASVLEVSQRMLKKLEIVGKSDTPDPIGRPGLVAKIFEEHAPELSVYAPFISSHPAAIKDLKQALAKVEKTEKLKASNSAKKLLGGGDKKRQQRQTFVNIWWEVSAKSNNLRGQTIESVMIMPVQRVPRYKLLLEQLMKELPKIDKDHPALEIIDESLEAVRVAARQINTACKQHAKLEYIFGQDTMISPNNAISKKDEEGKFMSILNSYVG